MRLKDRVVFITGASRGIGKACALACAREGAHIVVAAKSDAPHPRLRGTIGETAAAVEQLGVRALALRLDVRDAEACEAAVGRAIAHFGHVDVLVNNAGALWWADVVDTPVKRFDLIMGVNVRAAFVLSRAVLPHMIARRFGHLVVMAPPVDAPAVAHHAAYAVSKFGMTMIAQGIAEEVRPHNVAAHALWPATAIESAATETWGLLERKLWRKADILADAVVALVSRAPSERSGGAWIDEEVLAADGITDLAKYRCDPDTEPPRLTFRDIPALSRER